MLGRLLKDVFRAQRELQAEPSSRKPDVLAPPSAQGPLLPPESLHRRNLSKVTLIIPSVHRRAHHLAVCLKHLHDCEVDAQILISDHSEAQERGVIAQLVAESGLSRVTIIHHDPSLHFLDRLSDCAEKAVTDYVVVHADDDFMLPDTLEEAARFLDAHADHVACQGRTFFFRLDRSGRGVPSIHRSLSRQEPDPAQRIAEHCAHFTPTLYALTRREAFVRANRGALDFTDNVIFWQYLSSCLLVSMGRLRTLDGLYYLRLDNPQGWRATLVREADPTHWPYLIVAPTFSNELERFKRGLASCMGQLSTGDRNALIDKACLGLVRRAFAGPSLYDESEKQLMARFGQEGATERRILDYCSALAAEGLDRGRSAKAAAA